MKLFYASGACSLSPHIVLRELGLNFELEKVDLRTKKTERGEDFSQISLKGYVPHFITDNGEHLTEGAVIVQYLADLRPEANLIPKHGTMERVRVQEWLNYIGAEVHKSFTPLFNPEIVSTTRDIYTAKLKKSFDYISAKLSNNLFLMGETFSVADAYLFTVLNWATMVKIDLSPWPTLVDYSKRVAARPKVQEALKMEGLI